MGYKGILVTDGYQPYHTLAKERSEDLKVAGCWTMPEENLPTS